ncbi:MAG: hypothetical protein JXA98_00415 [Methanosarcinaceae archaeon]|nr:hypothetical protein [Methanosarcinaceae archaeon]
MRKRDHLNFVFMNGGTGTFSEKKKWKTGYSLFLEAKENKTRMPIIFSAADENNELIYFAFLESIYIEEKKTNVFETTYSLSDLTEMKVAKSLSSLVLRSSSKPLSDNYIRPYAICHTPDFLVNREIGGLPPIKKSRKSGSEAFHKSGNEQGFSLLDFWKWSVSDVVSNSQRGILAEFIVARALNLTGTIRSEWDAYDLLLPNGIKIEVKSSAYIQTWYQKDFSKISFGIPETKKLDEMTNKQVPASRRQADIYVFCLLNHKIQETIDPLNTDQWDFFILSTSVLNAKVGRQKKISLNSLKRLDPIHAKYEDLSHQIEELAGTIQT